MQKDPEHGLEITAPHETKIEVLGTSFNVEAFEKDPRSSSRTFIDAINRAAFCTTTNG